MQPRKPESQVTPPLTDNDNHIPTTNIDVNIRSSEVAPPGDNGKRTQALLSGPARLTTNVLQVDVSKAGLEKVDKAKIDEIVNSLSKGSAFYRNEQRRAEARQQRIAQLLQRSREFAALGPDALKANRVRVAALEAQLEAGRQFQRYVHLDMDMFYAAVEEKLNPALRAVPMGVGCSMMLSTTNYVARQYGVRAGMPGFIGQKLCPELVLVPLNFPAYRAEAATVRALAREYDPRLVTLGLDEVTMEVSAYLAAHPGRTAADVARELRERVAAATGLTASCGIGPTATLAKMASNYEKPNGQHELRLSTRDEVVKFMRPLELRRIPGIGKATCEVLGGLGVHTCGDVYADRHRLCFLFPPKTFSLLLSVSLGVMRGMIDIAERKTYSRQSICHESTVRAMNTRAEMAAVAAEIFQEAYNRLLVEDMHAEQVVLVLKDKSFEVHQQAVGIATGPTQEEATLRSAFDALLAPHLLKYQTYRLVGIRLAKLSHASDTCSSAGAKEVGRSQAVVKRAGKVSKSKATAKRADPALPVTSNAEDESAVTSMKRAKSVKSTPVAPVVTESADEEKAAAEGKVAPVKKVVPDHKKLRRSAISRSAAARLAKRYKAGDGGRVVDTARTAAELPVASSSSGKKPKKIAAETGQETRSAKDLRGRRMMTNHAQMALRKKQKSRLKSAPQRLQLKRK